MTQATYSIHVWEPRGTLLGPFAVCVVRHDPGSGPGSSKVVCWTTGCVDEARADRVARTYRDQFGVI
jgi:hypothetical protein